MRKRSKTPVDRFFVNVLLFFIFLFHLLLMVKCISGVASYIPKQTTERKIALHFGKGVSSRAEPVSVSNVHYVVPPPTFLS